MKTILLGLMAFTSLTASHTANAQMGWTLQQCREHFGPEFMPSNGNTHYFHVGPFGRGLGEHAYITFDPDGTVGEIEWLKLDGKAFSEAEIQQRLREASRVTWIRSPHHEEDELSWVGLQNDRVIFDANESNNGRGTWILTITTR